MVALLTESAEISRELGLLEKKVAAGTLTPASAAAEILARAFAKP
jgi:hypothetical protein